MVDNRMLGDFEAFRDLAYAETASSHFNYSCDLVVPKFSIFC